MGGIPHMIYKKRTFTIQISKPAMFTVLCPENIKLKCIFKYMCLLLKIQYGEAVKIFA